MDHRSAAPFDQAQTPEDIHWLRESIQSSRTSDLPAELDSSMDAFFIFRCVREEDRIVDFEFLFLNESAEEMISRGKQQVVGKCLREVIPTHRLSGILDLYKQVMKTGRSLVDEFAVNVPG
ncbi:MAG TPA: PAS domain-containing protein, partial [Acidisarcina sp.]